MPNVEAFDGVLGPRKSTKFATSSCKFMTLGPQKTILEN